MTDQRKPLNSKRPRVEKICPYVDKNGVVCGVIHSTYKEFNDYCPKHKKVVKAARAYEKIKTLKAKAAQATEIS